MAELDADGEYRLALEAWRAGDPTTARAHATAAVDADPAHRPARLLLGYALLNLGEDDAGLDTLAELARWPVSDALELEVQRAAARTVHRHDDPLHRDQVSIGFLQGFGAERRTDDWTSAGANAWTVGVPLAAFWGLRFDARSRWTSSVEDVGGWRLSPMVTAWTTSGRAAVDVGVGPSLWLAHGAWWRSQWHAYGGARLAVGADWRFGRRVGLRVEGAYMPHLHDRTLYWFRAPYEVRFGLLLWPQQPKSGRLAAPRVAAGG